MTVSVTIRTHQQLGIVERERRDPTWQRDSRRKSGTGRKFHHRQWAYAKSGRTNGNSYHFGPGWLMPRVLCTVTASIVWGICGQMADMPEY